MRRHNLIALAAAGVVGVSTSAPAQGAPRVAGGARSIGTTTVIAIPVQFAGEQAPVTKRVLQARMFDGPSDIGTLPEYFRENSRGAFTLHGIVTDWVQASMRVDAVSGTNFSQRTISDLAIGAINAVDPIFDFTQLDNDGPDGVPNSGDDDGIVDGGPLLYLSHRSTHCASDDLGLSGLTTRALITPDGGTVETADVGRSGAKIQVRGAAYMSAIRCDGTVAGLGVSAHEIGHLLFALPESYSIGGPTAGNGPGEGRRWRTGCWDLMAAGSGWGCGGAGHADREMATGLIPWQKQLLGWSLATVVGDVRNMEFVIEPLARGGRALRVPIADKQYWEIEYREPVGFDADLPGRGVLIYHVDSTRGRPVGCAACAVDSPPLLIEADGDLALQRTFAEGGNKGAASDAFGLGGRSTFSGATNPAALNSTGAPTTLTIHEIVVDSTAHVARLRLTTSATPAPLTPLEPTVARLPFSTVSIQSTIVGGALPYSWSASGLPAGVVSESQGSLLKLSGTIQAAGSFSPALTLTDARGTRATFAFQWSVSDIVANSDQVVRALLGDPSPLSAQESTFLDASGNRNQRLDVGDLRAYLLRNP